MELTFFFGDKREKKSFNHGKQFSYTFRSLSKQKKLIIIYIQFEKYCKIIILKYIASEFFTQG